MIKITTETTATVNGKKTIINKKKIWSYVISMLIILGITITPMIVCELLYPEIDIKAELSVKYITFFILQFIIYWCFIGAIIQNYFHTIYKFIKLKLFPM